jgi:alternate signal-mediated exported protein
MADALGRQLRGRAVKKSTKGGLAAAAAVLLLIGGMGTRASWSDDGVVPGTAMETGHLKLINAQCDGWLISGDLFDPASIKLAPGSVLTQICTFEVDALGANLKADLSVTAPTFQTANGLTAALGASATFEDGDGNAIVPESTELSDGETVTATLTVTLPSTVGNAVQDLSAQLQDVTVTATQV